MLNQEPTTMQMIQIAECYVNKSKNARQRKLEFSLSMSTFANIKLQTHCAYSGLPFTDEDELSLERLNNDLGYIDGNVVPVIRRLNTLRSNFSVEELIVQKNAVALQIKGAHLNIERVLSENYERHEQLKRLETLPEFSYVTVKKYKIPAKSVSKWVHLSNMLYGSSKRVKMRQNLISQCEGFVNGTSKRKLKKEKIKQHQKALAIHHAKMPELLKLEARAKEKLDAFIAPLSSTDVTKKVERNRNDGIKIQDTIANQERYLKNLKDTIVRLESQLDDYELIIVGLKKFDNLNDSEKMKLKMGLPLEYSTFKTFKHSLANRNLAVKI